MKQSRYVYLSIAILVVAGLVAFGLIFRAAQQKGDDSFRLTSSAFENMKTLPLRFTCWGQAGHPPLIIHHPPKGSKSLALILNQVNLQKGEVVVYWTVWGIPPTTRRLDPGKLPEGAREGTNDFGQVGYTGPCPRTQQPETFIFTLYALDGELNLPQGASVNEMVDGLVNQVDVLGITQLRAVARKPSYRI